MKTGGKTIAFCHKTMHTFIKTECTKNIVIKKNLSLRFLFIGENIVKFLSWSVSAISYYRIDVKHILLQQRDKLCVSYFFNLKFPRASSFKIVIYLSYLRLIYSGAKKNSVEIFSKWITSVPIFFIYIISILLTSRYRALK